MRARHIPNIISVLRVLLVYPVAHYMLNGRYELALSLFIVAGVSDGLDGFLAKHYHWQSKLGSLLDPLADKLLLLTCFILGAHLGLLPVWVTAAVVARDVVILGGAIAYYLLLHPFEGRPHWTSKLNTFLQLVLIVAVLFEHGVAPLPPLLLSTLTCLVLATTALSGIIYVLIWGRSYWRETRGG
ncbi:CDP-alcohol phosphatidyltransferase family protein [Methylococcus sp. EFPC2]|nr:CDP-alcohol phosphatidyltransferase family protein [Methylococcus sp. EFPC2]